MNTGRLYRLLHSARLTLASGSSKKKAYADKHGLFALYGSNVVFQPKTLPLYSQLIKIHDNVVIGRKVEFVTHDVLHRVANAAINFPLPLGERIGCIEVCENVFVGNGAIIMYGVRIAPNNIIAAGSVVTKSTEPNSVYAGVPAKRIGTFSESIAKRYAQESSGRIATVKRNQQLVDEEIVQAWELFDAGNSENDDV